MNEDTYRTTPFTEGNGNLFRIVDKCVTYFETYDSKGKSLNYPAQDIIYHVVPTDGYDCNYEGGSKISFFPSPPCQQDPIPRVTAAHDNFIHQPVVRQAIYSVAAVTMFEYILNKQTSNQAALWGAETTC